MILWDNAFHDNRYDDCKTKECGKRTKLKGKRTADCADFCLPEEGQ